MNRRQLLTILLGSFFSAGSQAFSQSMYQSASALPIGQIVGAEWIRRRRTFRLYCTQPEHGRETLLLPDDVIKTALASSCGDFSFSFEPTSAEHLEVRYLSHLLVPEGVSAEEKEKLERMKEKVEERLRGLFFESTTEEIFYSCDRFLKSAGQGRDLPQGLPLTPSGYRLCLRELEEWVRAGKKLKEYPETAYVTYFTLQLRDRSGRFRGTGFEGVGRWFSDRRILVKTEVREGAAVPDCVKEFGDFTTRQVEKLLGFPGEVSNEFRRLSLILTLHKVFAGFARKLFVPIDDSILESYQTRRVDTDHRIPIRKLPIVLRDTDGTLKKLTIAGGIRFSSNFVLPLQGGPTTGMVRPPVYQPAPRFQVTTVPDSKLLRIDLSEMLFGRR